MKFFGCCLFVMILVASILFIFYFLPKFSDYSLSSTPYDVAVPETVEIDFEEELILRKIESNIEPKLSDDNESEIKPNDDLPNADELIDLANADELISVLTDKKFTLEQRDEAFKVMLSSSDEQQKAFASELIESILNEGDDIERELLSIYLTSFYSNGVDDFGIKMINSSSDSDRKVGYYLLANSPSVDPVIALNSVWKESNPEIASLALDTIDSVLLDKEYTRKIVSQETKEVIIQVLTKISNSHPVFEVRQRAQKKL